VIAQLERFWSLVDRGPDTDSCWLWRGKVNARGYGRYVSTVAHRFSLSLATGGDQHGKMACHQCDNRLGVNPVHLYWGDAKTNAHDASIRRRYGDRKVDRNARFVEMAGKRFKRLLVLWPLPVRLQTLYVGRVTHNWVCQCDCGTICIVPGGAMRCGNTGSCGCQSRRSASERFSKMLTFNGITQNLSAWSKYAGVNQRTLAWRLKNWPLERALARAQ